MIEQNCSLWWVYIVHCADGSLYTGATTNVIQRIEIHNLGKGAKYTRSRLPVTLLYQEALSSKSAALKREIQIKKLSHLQKQALATQYWGSKKVE